MSARAFCNLVYSIILDGADAETRDKLDAQIYAPAIGLDAANANLWAAIQQAED